MSAIGQPNYPIVDPSQPSQEDHFNITIECSSFYEQPHHMPTTSPNSSPFLTCYGSPISPGLSSPLNELTLNSHDSDYPIPIPHSSALLTVPTQASQSCTSHFMMSSQNQSEPLPGTVPGSHASFHEHRGRPTIMSIQTQFSPVQYPSPYLSSGSTPSSSASPFPFTPNTPSNAGTGPAFHTKSLPSDDHGHATTIDPTVLLEPTLDADRGRSLDVHALGNRRSRNSVNAESSNNRVSRQSSRLGPQPRPARHRQQSRERSPLPLELNSFTVDTTGVQMSMSILFDTDSEPFDPESFLGLGPFDIAGWDGDRSQSADDDTIASASIYQDRGQKVNGKRPGLGNEAEQQPGFRPVVASDEVVHASKSRRTTTGPRFKCDMDGCNADFTAKHNLKNHINAHKGVKNYVCTFCDRKYTTSHVLNRHKKTCKQGKLPKRKATRQP
ncbi:hypothetical protein PM082_022567 [Marasmius tenuissimus]|nr:hypothetical protein PM082_022567 [Marasmius tenuissimus]